MKWAIGIDEAGYGPNIGPFVMSAVACRVTADGPACLWQRLAATVKRARPAARKGDSRLVVDDSKLVHSGKGVAGLERGTLPFLPHVPDTLAGLISLLCPQDAPELAAERWYTGKAPLPTHATDLPALRQSIAACAERAGVSGWVAASVVVCPPRFNLVVERAGTKSAILADSLVRLLGELLRHCEGADAEAHIDKQGGRNSYLLQLQQATGAPVRVLEEGEQASRYEATLPDRRLSVSFLPRADAAHFPVALASMLSKYLRELFMAELNAFWRSHLPGLEPTAGYPGDAPRFLEAIRPVAASLGIPEASIWRSR